MKKLRIVSLLAFICFALCADIAVTPTYIARSQGRDKLRTLVGTLGYGYTDRFNPEGWYGNLSALVAYTQSFRNDKIGACIFGTDLSCSDCDSIVVQGSQVADRKANAWLADYLYLGCDFEGAFQFKPQIQNVLIDFDFYLGLDEMLDGAYVRLYGPVTWTKWQTNFCANVLTGSQTTACREGYFTAEASEELLISLDQYFCGMVPTTTEAIIFQPLRFGKFGNCDESKWGFAELRVELGYNFVQKEDTHIGVNVQMAVPTGGKRRAEFVFDPVVGNGDHWEFGGGFTAHYMFYRDESTRRIAGWFTDLSITHIFKSIEERTFDLTGKPNSRYMLAAKFSSPIQDNLSGSNLPDTSAPTLLNITNPTAQFAGEYSPVANLTTIGINVKNTIQVDWVTMFHVGWDNWSIDVGYNLWVRTCENILNSRGDNDFCPFGVQPTLFDESQDDTWVLKGDANMFGYATATAGGLIENQAIALSATQNNATIHKGTNVDADGNDPELVNSGIDNARFAYAGTTNQQLNFAPDLLATSDFHIKTSINPEFINFENIEFQPVRGLSNKLFVHVSYNWDREKYIPYLGFGGAVEFGQNKVQQVMPSDSPITFIDTCDSECLNCSLSQWAVWLKAGVAFE